MSNGAYVGMAVCSHNNGTLNTSLFDNVSASFLTNVPPVISWVVPANNTTFIQPKTITLTASATDPNGTVTNVAFFNGTTLLGNGTSGVGSVIVPAVAGAGATRNIERDGRLAVGGVGQRSPEPGDRG